MKLEILDSFQRDNCNRLKKNTLNKYLLYVRQFFDDYQGEVADITSKDIKKWLKALNGIYKPATICNKLCGLKEVFAYCVEEGILDVNPAENIKGPRFKSATPAIPSEEEVLLIEEAAKDNIVDQLVIIILACTGMRPEELANVMLEHVDIENLQIDIWEGKGLKERWVPITYLCSKKIEEYLRVRKATTCYFLVRESGKGYTRQSIYYTVKKYVDIAGINKLIGPKSFRYFLAGLLARKEFTIDEIAKILGHKNFQHTKRYISLSSNDIDI